MIFKSYTQLVGNFVHSIHKYIYILFHSFIIFFYIEIYFFEKQKMDIKS